MKTFRPQMLTPLILVAIVLMMIVPMPAVMLDVMLAANFTLAVLALLAAMLLTDSLEFSVFPSSLPPERGSPVLEGGIH
jgi:flagellar biosynthesis protein FlhA